MSKPLIALACALAFVVPLSAQEAPAAAPSPGEIVAQATPAEWVAIPASDLLVMTLAPDAEDHARRVVIQLMPAPFSQGWVDNIRTFARAKWYDNISVNRVQDNYVVQWGDPNYDNPEATGETKPLPTGLRSVPETDYTTSVEALGDAAGYTVEFEDALADAENPAVEAAMAKVEKVINDPSKSEADHEAAIAELAEAMGLTGSEGPSATEELAMVSISQTQTPDAPEGWHQRDSYAQWTEIWQGWPIANFEISKWVNEAGSEVPDPKLPRHEARAKQLYKEVEESWFWPVHCYGMVGVGRNLSPDTGSGAELYTVIGHAPRHLDRNIALVGRVIEGIEHLSSLPRGKGELGFYAADEVDKRTPILTVRVASDLPPAEQPQFQYLNTEGETFARYAEARANRRDPFFNVPAGGADICNIPVPVRRVPG